MPSRRLAALYDIHGNLPALDAALAAAEEADVDTILIGGDIVLGPIPAATLERLRALGTRARCIRGNCDRLVVEAFDETPSRKLPAPVAEAVAWTAAQLSRDQRDFLAALPETLSLDVAGLGPVLFCHATPRSDEEIVTTRTPLERMRTVLDDVAEKIVVCGHTHMQFDRAIDGRRLVNAGSVGMPYGAPGAHWLLVDTDLRPRRTTYDLDAAARAVRATAYPRAEEFARQSILHPPSEEAMLELLGG
ncbi:MAG: metallophosphoesterase family protein [Gemmatimonadaceae bacterium]|nr:metallophosphoesterase family protein [Gemmatimonadaceae bacterium]NUQ93817.1 metallophosphoesterase family protein [Gemmatimonadaceae bacterium]NUR19229.1 metallophosphoesterase family protein [Gemmatimonadaceae bacterium]